MPCQRLKALKGVSAKALSEKYGFSGAAIVKSRSDVRRSRRIFRQLVGNGPSQIAAESAYLLSRLPDEASQRELAQAIITQGLAPPGRRRSCPGEGRQTQRSARRKGRVSCKLDGGVSVTVSTADALTWEGLLTPSIACVSKRRSWRTKAIQSRPSPACCGRPEPFSRRKRPVPYPPKAGDSRMDTFQWFCRRDQLPGRCVLELFPSAGEAAETVTRFSRPAGAAGGAGFPHPFLRR